MITLRHIPLDMRLPFSMSALHKLPSDSGERLRCQSWVHRLEHCSIEVNQKAIKTKEQKALKQASPATHSILFDTYS